MKKESVDPQDDKKPGIERSSSDEKDGVKISIDVEGAVVDIGERVVEVPVSERAQGPIKRRTAYFQALCDDLKKSYLEKGNSI